MFLTSILLVHLNSCPVKHRAASVYCFVRLPATKLSFLLLFSKSPLGTGYFHQSDQAKTGRIKANVISEHENNSVKTKEKNITTNINFKRHITTVCPWKFLSQVLNLWSSRKTSFAVMSYFSMRWSTRNH